MKPELPGLVPWALHGGIVLSAALTVSDLRQLRSSSAPGQTKNPLDFAERVLRTGRRTLYRAHDVARLETLRALEQIELDGLAFVQRAVAVLLDGREMHEDILAGGALDESVSLRAVEPLHSTLLSHKETPFASCSELFFRRLSVCPALHVLVFRRQETGSMIEDTATGHPLEVTVRIFCWRRRAHTAPHQQKRLPCIPSDGCPRRNTVEPRKRRRDIRDRKSTRLNSSHLGISYAVFCL